MLNSASIRRRAWTIVLAGPLLALIVSATAQRSLAQTDQDWIGKRVVTKFGTVLRVGKEVVDDLKLENADRGVIRRLSRIYRIEHVNGPWLWIQDERSTAAGWVKAEWIIPYDQAMDYFTSGSAQRVQRGSLHGPGQRLARRERIR